jgi:hypothetical protein
MGTVSPLQPPVNPGTKHKVADVIAWVEAQSKKADMGATSARLRITSLKQMYEQVAEDEPHDDVGWLLENMDRMSERWARRNQSSAAATAKDYASRAKNTIQQYLKWFAAPDAYKFDPKRGAVGTEKTAHKPTKKASAPVVPVIPVTSAQDSPRATANETRNFPLGEGRGAILFALPAGGVTFADVRKFAVHLFTLATDFNIADEGQAKTFQMVVRGGE